MQLSELPAMALMILSVECFTFTMKRTNNATTCRGDRRVENECIFCIQPSEYSSNKYWSILKYSCIDSAIWSSTGLHKYLGTHSCPSLAGEGQTLYLQRELESKIVRLSWLGGRLVTSLWTGYLVTNLNGLWNPGASSESESYVDVHNLSSRTISEVQRRAFAR